MKRYIILWLELKQIQLRSDLPAEKKNHLLSPIHLYVFMLNFEENVFILFEQK